MIAHIGAIEVLSALGQGAKSHVMLVRREADQELYALKIVAVAKRKERKYLAQARQEYRVLQLLNHPNIVRVHSLETETDWLARPRRVKLLLEYVPGQTLDRLTSPGIGTLLKVFEQAADAIAYMHERGIIHADLKPNNIMVGSGLVKLIDFGLARVSGEPAPDRLQGTPEYMAPETATRKVVDCRTDIFNFGATMYRLLTGLYPPASVGVLPSERSYREQYRETCEVSHAVPAALGGLVDACLRYQPGERPATMDEVARTLNRIVDECGVR
jgi:serine/threonine protein kinase